MYGVAFNNGDGREEYVPSGPGVILTLTAASGDTSTKSHKIVKKAGFFISKISIGTTDKDI